MNREQNVQTPVMMPSPHLSSTVLRDPKKMRPEESYMGVYSITSEQQQQPLPPQQQHHQTPMDYKYGTPFYGSTPFDSHD
jgi:cohesin complex subunit SA-1/2